MVLWSGYGGQGKSWQTDNCGGSWCSANVRFSFYRVLAFALIVIWRVYLPFRTLRSVYTHGQMSGAGGSSKDRYDASVEVEADVVHFRFGCGPT